MHLVNRDGEKVDIGDEVTTNRGELVTITRIDEPHKPGSTGRVYAEPDMTHGYFPGVFGLKWVGREDQG